MAHRAGDTVGFRQRGEAVKQARARPILGAIQVQLQSSMFYVSFVLFLLNSTTFWYVAGYQLAQKYAPWVTIEVMYAGFVVLLAFVGFIDWKFILPARMAFNNIQGCKTTNPFMDRMDEVQEDLRSIKEKLGIENQDKAGKE